MNLSMIIHSPWDTPTDAVVIGLYEEIEQSPSLAHISPSALALLKKRIEQSGFKGKNGQSVIFYDLEGFQAERLLLIGLGKNEPVRPAKWSAAIALAMKRLSEDPIEKAIFAPFPSLASLNDGLKAPLSEQVSLPIVLSYTARLIQESLYRYSPQPPKQEEASPPPTLKELTFTIPIKTEDPSELAKWEMAILQGTAIARGTALTRQLGDLPPNICTPSYLAEQALALAEGESRLKVTIHDEKAIEEMKMGAFLAVAKGSRQPPRLIEMHYQGAESEDAPVVLVGKGITFDSGGISIKPSAAMDEMKYDMGGAAAVLGTMQSLITLRAPINVVGLIPTCENLPDGDAVKPGDIITSLSGQTIEVLNTDAEGRLILCDALTYAEQFNPSVVVDVATLTGACVVALGSQAHGLLSSDMTLLHDLLDAGEEAFDRAWPLPLWEEYQEGIKSSFADLPNIASGRDAGTITAACFLSRFTKNYPWAHFDIAGTAWNAGSKKGATGRPVPLLIHYLINRE